MSTSNHWNDLASKLGAEPAPTPPPKPAASPPAAARPPARPTTPAPPRPQSATDWGQLAGQLGVAPSPASSPPPRRPSQATPPPLPTTSGGSSRVEREPISQSRAEPRHEREAVVEPRQEVREPSPDRAPGSARPAGARDDEDRPRRRRRRGGRGRSRRGDRDRDTRTSEPQSSVPDDDFEERTDLDREELPKTWSVEAEFFDEETIVPLDAESDQPLSDDRSDSEPRGEGSDDDAPRPRRRRRRRGRGRRDREERGGIRTPAAPEGESEVSHDAEMSDSHLDGPHDLDHLEDDGGDEDGSESMLDKSHRTVPSWQEAIGMIVAVNMEARATAPNSRPAHRQRGRGGRGRSRRGGSR